ncbi:caspase, EACC1-associated type [Nocardia sp. CA-151230]|uniref:caspase, EACC1-associated type n=1 Tax=Nocardia sp. CA-151230 TaxID=3239982 RepID=UPI003D8FDE12
MEPDREPHSDSRAILVGVGRYDDEALPDVPAAVNSLHAMDELLRDSELCRWPEDRVTVLENCRDAVELALTLRRLAEETTGTLLLYFVGHGVLTDKGELCLATGSTRHRDPDLTGLEFAKVRGIFLNSPARVKLVILDCCYSGRVIHGLSPAGDGELASATDVRGVYTLTAADRTAHVPALAEQDSACTSFTGAFRDVVRQGVPGGPPTLALSHLYQELWRLLRQRDLPEPNQRGTDTVDLYTFTQNAAYRPPANGASAFRLIPSEREELFFKIVSAQPVHGLTDAALSRLDDRPGVYQIYLKSADGERDRVYVGKSDRSVPERLLNHRRKIEGRRNIDISDVSFNYLLLDDDLSYVAPEFLLLRRSHKLGETLPWNNAGFGNKDPGRQRDITRLKSGHFDALYPIDLSWSVRTDGQAELISVDSLLVQLKSELPYVFRYGLRDRALENVLVELPQGDLSADGAFRLLAEALGDSWQITALLGYVVMYQERDRQYPSAFRYYVGSRSEEASPDIYEDLA